MRNTLLVILILCFTKTCFAQETSLTGKVVDYKTNEPLPGVTIYVDTVARANTDLNGEYILFLNPGEHIITFRLLSYEITDQKISINAGEKKTVNFSITSV